MPMPVKDPKGVLLYETNVNINHWDEGAEGRRVLLAFFQLICQIISEQRIPVQYKLSISYNEPTDAMIYKLSAYGATEAAMLEGAK